VEKEDDEMKRMTMRCSAAAIVVFFGGVLFTSACNSEAPPPSNAPAPPAGNANASATNTAPAAPGHGTAHTGPLEGADLAKAQQLFKANCAVCHLESGKGDPHHKKDAIPDFTNAAWHEGKTDAALIASITNGKGKVMPAFKGKLSDADIGLLVHYVHEFPTRATSDTKGGAPSPTGTSSKPKPGAKGKPKAGEHGGHGEHPN